jgi:hypothetical protein
MVKHNFSSKHLHAFMNNYDISHQDVAEQARGKFLNDFPLKALEDIELDEYVIGLQKPTFCDHVEAKTRPWANIQGATSNKFGIYFGKTKGDPKKIYRFTKKFGKTKAEAFRAVKAALLDLIHLGAAPTLDFEEIDNNPLSQMFKAKILSLYFPDRFLNVCSADHLEHLGMELGFGEDLFRSEYQHLILTAKFANLTTKDWTNPKFMAFLYDTYINVDEQPTPNVRKPHKKAGHRKVNFEDVQNQRGEIGKAAEEFALKWEKERLEGAGRTELISKIEDRRDRPGYGYDFLSHTASDQKRFIEVKSVAKLPNGEGYRFYLSDNERSVSLSADHKELYFFYLVFFGKNREPKQLKPICASALYQESELVPASYVVRFEFE